MTVLIAILLCIIMTFIGGKIAYKFHNTKYKSNLLGFSAGAVLGVAFFDLLPEAFSSHINSSKLFL